MCLTEQDRKRVEARREATKKREEEQKTQQEQETKHPQVQKEIVLPPRQFTDLSTRSSLASAPLREGTEQARAASVLMEEDEDDFDEEKYSEDKGEWSVIPEEDIPWHHKKLYELYGKEADSFLYPKFEEDQKKPVGPINPKLRQQGGEIKFYVLLNECQTLSIETCCSCLKIDF